jgi:hypothetical protein
MSLTGDLTGRSLLDAPLAKMDVSRAVAAEPGRQQESGLNVGLPVSGQEPGLGPCPLLRPGGESRDGAFPW